MDTNQSIFIPNDDSEYYLTKWHHIEEMVEHFPEVVAFFEERFSLFWEEEDVDTLNDALSQWVSQQLEEEHRKSIEELDRDLKQMYEKEEKEHKMQERKKKSEWVVREIKPSKSRGYHGFSDWDEIGDDYYLG